jgi:hypothetical protein
MINQHMSIDMFSDVSLFERPVSWFAIIIYKEKL